MRHPKSLVFSATNYHLKCKELWVDIPLEKCDINTFASILDPVNYQVIKSDSVALEDKVLAMNNSYDVTPEENLTQDINLKE